MKKIYSKIAKERRNPFQIETYVTIEDDKKYIVKRPLNDESVAHIANMYKKYENSCYKELLCVSHMNNGSIWFDYVEGNTLGQQIVDALERGKKSDVEVFIQKYKDIIKSMTSLLKECDVEDNDEFRKIFGAKEIEEKGYKGLVFDLTFDNIMYSKGRYVIIDYEWNFDISISIDFIMYRAVFAFYTKNSHLINKMYTRDEFMALFNIPMEKIETYMHYNESFIRYVYGEYNDIIVRYRRKNQDFNQIKRVLNAFGDTGIEFEGKIFDDLLEQIKENKTLYDDYNKFFDVSSKLRNIKGEGYLLTDTFSSELSAYIMGNYDMINYYRKESEEKEKIIQELNSKLDKYRRSRVCRLMVKE